VERCANSLFSLVKDLPTWLLEAGRETTGSDPSRRGMTVPFALAAATGISSVTGAFSAGT
jgi:hypothetical protein